MRVSTLFNRILSLNGATVVGVAFSQDTVIVEVRLRRRRLVCPCGASAPGCYDRRRRRWRHLDLAGRKLFLECELRRLRCPACARIVTEAVPWARPGARHSLAFEQLVCWLAQRSDKTTVATQLRISWETVAAIITRAIDDYLDDTRLDGLRRIGVDEIHYLRRRGFLTVVADHDHGGRVVWVGMGRSAATLELFYRELGQERTGDLHAVTMDLAPTYAAATRRAAPHARRVLDPFHVIGLITKAIDQSRRFARGGEGAPPTRDGRALRWALLKSPASHTPAERALLGALRREQSALFRAFILKEDLRGLYKLEQPHLASAYLRRWCDRASRSRIPPMVGLARTLRANADDVVAAVELGLSNSRLEGLNSKIRLINHRGYGHHSAAALAAMIYLCCGGLKVELPFG